MIISYKKGKANKIHIYIDDEYQISTTEGFLSNNFFASESEITQEEWEELVEKINYAKAVNKCYDLLAIRSHSKKELFEKLLKKYDYNSSSKAIDLMEELGYINDEEYAKELLDYLLNNKKLSKSFIALEMKKRGVDSAIYDELLSDADIDDIGVAYDIINSKYLTKLNENGGRNKVIAALARKGFRYSDIVSALDMIENDDEF
jgi:regulatory protein